VETWVIVVLVLGSNAIMGAVNWLMMKRQLKHSKDQLEKQLQAQGESNKRERQREVRSEPLLKLRSELARMSAKGERVAFLGIPLSRGKQSKRATEDFKEALADWNAYMASREFEEVLFMQDDFVLMGEVGTIKTEYDVAQYRFGAYWKGFSSAEKVKGRKEVVDVVKRNRRKIAEVQSDINKRLEEL